MSISILNTDAGLSGKTLINLEDGQTVTGLKTYDRDPNPPFGVTSGSAVVANLDADKVDGIEAAAMGQLAVAATWTAAQRFPVGAVGAPGIAIREATTGIYSTGAGALEVATSGAKALGIDSTQFIDSPTQPRCAATASGGQTLTTAVAAAVTFNTDVFDVGSMHDTVSNTSRFTIPAGGDGLYLIHAIISFNSNATGERITSITKNGASVNGTTVRLKSNTVAAHQQSTSALETAVAGDYFEVTAYQDSGGNLSISSFDYSRFHIVKLW